MALSNAVVTVAVDGIQKEKFICNLPNIRSLRAFLKGQWNLAEYDSCFPRRSRLGDVDGSVEINGRTLHVEFKESKWSLNQGQILKAIRQARYNGIFTIFVFGKTDLPTSYLLFTPDELQPEYVECDVESLKEVFKDWVKYTEANNPVEDKTSEWQLTDKYFGRGK